MERKLPMPKPLGTQYQNVSGEDLTLLWTDFDSSLDLDNNLVICLDESDRRIVVMTRSWLRDRYRQVPDNNLELDFGE